MGGDGVRQIHAFARDDDLRRALRYSNDLHDEVVCRHEFGGHKRQTKNSRLWDDWPQLVLSRSDDVGTSDNKFLRTPKSLNYLTILQNDSRARLHRCRASSLVDVRNAAFSGVADHSHGVLTEMRAASGHCASTLHPSSTRAGQETAEPAMEITHSGSIVRIRSGEEITNLGFSIHAKL